MKKLLICIALCALLALSACASPAQPGQSAQTPAQEPAAQLPNPVAEVDDASAFAALGLAIDAPEGASQVRYSIISDQIAQVNYAYENRAYTYRAANTGEDISGVYETFDPEALGVEADGEGWYASLSVQTVSGGEKGALAKWQYGQAQYTLYTGDSISAEEMGTYALALAQKVCPPQEPQASGDAALTQQTQEALTHMLPVLDSILRTVGIEGEAKWDPADPAQLWTALYLLGVNWEWENSQTLQEGGNLIVPANVMRQWATAFTAQPLPDKPDSVDWYSYDAGRDAYVMELSDAGDSETGVESCYANDDGSYGVNVDFTMGDGTYLGGLRFTLAPNQNADNGGYAFTVLSAERS